MDETATAEIRGLEETARFFEISTPTLRKLILEDEFPIVERGGNGIAYKFDLRKVAVWLKNRKEKKDRLEEEQAERDAQLKLELLGEDQLPEVADGKMSQKQRREAIAAELSKVQLAKLRRELVNADDMQFKILGLFKTIRERLRLLPDELARDLGLTDEQAETGLEIVDNFLKDLADEFEAAVKDDTDAAA